MKRVALCAAMLLTALASSTAAAETTYRLYDALTAFVSNPDGKDFTVSLDVRDINHLARGPAELLVKIYDPEGVPVVREVVPDDGVVANTSPPLAGWDHEAWYYATCYSRGLDPLVKWSAFSDPARLAGMLKRTISHTIHGGKPGVYRIVLVGSPDHYVTLKMDPALAYGVSGGPDWLHGHHDVFRKSYFYVPRGTVGMNLSLLEFDQPANRVATVKNAKGETILTADSSAGLAKAALTFDKPDQYDDQVLTLEISSGPGDYFLDFNLAGVKETRNRRGQPVVMAVLAPDEATAKVLKNGAIYHDDQVFWQMHQVRLHEWIKRNLKPGDDTLPANLAKSDRQYISVGSHNSPHPGSADRIMHDYPAHKSPQALNAAIRDMLDGLRLIGPTDAVMHGRNLAYEMGTYSFFYHRPAWRILQQTDAPDEVKSILKEFIIQIGDRLAFARGIELVNGNSLASLLQALRYCQEASGDPLQKELFETYWTRFTTGGFGDRFGVGPSGGVQEGYGYDHHYGSYVLRGWRAGLVDLKDARFQKVYDGVMNLYSYTYSLEDNAAPWGSRTHLKLPGGVYDPWLPNQLRWKGLGGPNLTESVNGANEFFAARRKHYFALAYYGRITPSWLGEGFHGQIGFSGGVLCQLHVPDHGQVFASTLHGDYGGGMHPSNWRNFHLHGLMGMTADGRPLVSSYCECPDARLEGNTVTGSGEVRESSVHVTRSYTFEEDAIACSVKLRDSAHDKVFGIYGGAHGLRNFVTEAYEMLPYVRLKVGGNKTRTRPEQPTELTALDADSKPLGSLTKEPLTAAAAVIDRGGFGVRVELDKPRPVLLGNESTLMIQVVKDKTPANAVALSYRVVPFIGEAGKIGSTPAAEVVKKISKLPAMTAADQVASALGNTSAYSVMEKGQAVAEVRFGLSGDHLAVHAKVMDADVNRGEPVWKGSNVEVFGSTPGSTKIGQVMLAPAAGDKPALGFKSEKGVISPAPQIKLTSAPTPTGYEIQGLIPLSLLALDSKTSEVAIEFQIDRNPPPVGKAKTRPAMVYTTLFGSKRAYEDNFRYARFVVE